MVIKANLGLSGEYRVSVYKKDGTLSYSLEPKSNFITSTGLSMPLDHPIADCFRFISLGSGTTQNSIISNGGEGTTGLSIGVPQFMYIGSRPSISDPGHLQSRYMDASFKEQNNVLTLSRGWRIPVEAETFDNDYTFKEFMLSPGRPYVTGISAYGSFGPYDVNTIANGSPNGTISATPSPGWTINQFTGHYVVVTDDMSNIQIRKVIGNSAFTLQTSPGTWESLVNQLTFAIYPEYRLCHCSDSDYDYRPDTGTVYGADCGSPAAESRDLGKPICAQTGAFVRVLSNIPVKAGEYLVINYTLYVTVDSGVKQFQLAINRGGRTIGLGDDNNWNGYSSGAHALVHHGLRLISPGTVNTTGPWQYGMPHPYSSFDPDSDFGESFVGSWGDPLEPSKASQNLNCYVTTDYLQFAANNRIGGKYDSEVGFQNTSGLMYWHATPYEETSATFPQTNFNIRLPNNHLYSASINNTPNPLDYREESADPSNDYGFDIVYGFKTFGAVSPESFTHSSRSRTIARNYEFAGPTLNTETPNMCGKYIRGMVLSFQLSDMPEYNIPYLDVVFSDTGFFLMPAKDRYNNSPNSWHLDTVDNGNGQIPQWYYLETDAKLNFWFRETWSSPCPSDVAGC